MFLDMYRPADVSVPLPAVLVFHDDGWLCGGLGWYNHYFFLILFIFRFLLSHYTYNTLQRYLAVHYNIITIIM